MPDKPFFVYYAPGATHAPHHVPAEWSDKYKGRFDAGWDALREETLARQKELGVVPADAELTGAPRRDPGLGRHARRPEAGPRPPDGGLRRLHGAHRPPRRPADRRPRRPRDPRRHARLRDRRRQRRLRRGHAQRLLQRAASSSTAPPASRRPSSWPRASTSSARPRPTTTTRSAGPTRWTRPTSGPSRSPRTGAAPATGRSSTGPAGIKAKGEVRTQFHHVIDIAATVLDAAGLPEPTFVHGVQQMPLHGVSHGLLVRRRGGRRAARDPVLRDVLQPRHLPQGLDRGDPPQHAVGDGAEPAARRRRVGALRARRLDAGARPRRRAAREAGRAAAAVPDRGGEVQRPAARRPPRRALQPRPRRAPAARPAATASSCSAAWAG